MSKIQLEMEDKDNEQEKTRRDLKALTELAEAKGKVDLLELQRKHLDDDIKRAKFEYEKLKALQILKDSPTDTKL